MKNKARLENNNNQPTLDQESNLSNILEIFYSDDKIDKTTLVKGKKFKSTKAKTMLEIINMKDDDPKNLLERRKVNKAFFDGLLEIKGGQSSALVWLKRSVDFDICDILLSDWKHTGN